MNSNKNHPITGGKAVIECLKAHKIKSPIVKDYSVLHSYLKFYPSSELKL